MVKYNQLITFAEIFLEMKNKSYVKTASILVLYSLIVYIASVNQSLLTPIIIGFILSIVLLPVSRWQEKYLRFPRVVSSVTSPLLFTILIIGVGSVLISQASAFSEDFPLLKQQTLQLVKKLQAFISENFNVNRYDQYQFLENHIESGIQKGSSMIGSILMSITSILVSMGFVFLYSFFFLLYRGHLYAFLLKFFGTKSKTKVQDISISIKEMIKQYLLGLTIQGALMSAMLLISFWIIGIKYAFLLAIICAFLNVIPYIGIITGTALTCLLTLATGEPIDVVYVVIAVIIVHFIDANIVTPKVIGSKVKVNSFIVFLGIVLGEHLWGIAGMFLAIPILAILKIIFDHNERYQALAFLFGEENDNPNTPTE